MFDEIKIIKDEKKCLAKIVKGTDAYFITGTLKTIFRKIEDKIKKI
jgi:hypothetical protein